MTAFISTPSIDLDGFTMRGELVSGRHRRVVVNASGYPVMQFDPADARDFARKLLAAADEADDLAMPEPSGEVAS